MPSDNENRIMFRRFRETGSKRRPSFWGEPQNGGSALAPPSFCNPRKDRRGSETLFSPVSLARRNINKFCNKFPNWRGDEGDEKHAEGDFHSREKNLKSPTTEPQIWVDPNLAASFRRPWSQVASLEIFDKKYHGINERGQVVIFFVLLIPLFVLLMVVSVKFSRVVLTKIKLQQTADKAIFAGASYLTEVLNQAALSNRKVHQKFLDLNKKFEEGSKLNRADAKKEIAKTLAEQNQILDEAITPRLEEAYAKAYAIADQIVQKEFPEARLIPLYSLPVRIGEGKTRELGFDEIKGVVFDPTGHQGVASDGFTARVAFRKNDQDQMALAGGLQFQSLRAVAAAQPKQGSLWDYALSGKEERLYQTTMVPLKTLSPEGYIKWEDFNPYAVEH